jgi:S1-C subfamily serine protease
MEETQMNKKIPLSLSACLLLVFIGPAFSTIDHTFVSKAEAQSLKDVFQKVNPAVVVITTKKGGFPITIPQATLIKSGLGSGIVISKRGLVMTSAHVVQDADEVMVHFLNSPDIPATVISTSPQADVALLKLDYVPDDLEVVEPGDSDRVSIGEMVFVVGAPYGVEHTLTVGYLSGRRHSVGVCKQLTPIEFLQTDAAINMGNSGGPMFSVNGELIGIVSGILSRSGGSEGLGFATSINTAKELLSAKESFWVGLNAFLVQGALAKALNVPQDAALLIQSVSDGSPAYKLGLRPSKIPIQIGKQRLFIGGDIILEVQGTPISSDAEETCDIRDSVGRLNHGDSIVFKILRDGRILNLSASR